MPDTAILQTAEEFVRNVHDPLVIEAYGHSQICLLCHTTLGASNVHSATKHLAFFPTAQFQVQMVISYVDFLPNLP